MADPKVTVETPPRKPIRGGLFGHANIVEQGAHIGAGVQYIRENCVFPQLTPGLCWADILPVDVERTNFVTGPQITSATQGWGDAGGAVSYSAAGQQIDGEIATGTNVAVKSVDISAAPADATFSGSLDVTFANTGAESVTLRLDLYDPNGGVTAPGAPQVFAPGATHTLVTGALDPTGSSVRLVLVVDTDVVPATGSVTINHALLEAAAVPGVYFDGSSAIAEPQFVRWTGATNGSTSQIYVFVTAKTFEGIDFVSFGSFVLHSGVECFLNGDDGDFEARARRQLAQGEQQAVERIFEENVLANLPVVTSQFSDVLPEAEVWLAQNYPALGTIHARRDQVADWFEQDALEHDAAWNVFTRQGTPVANGAGYRDSAVRLTGQVTIWRGAVQSYVANDLTTNRRMAIAERIYVIGYDCAGVELAPDQGS